MKVVERQAPLVRPQESADLGAKGTDSSSEVAPRAPLEVEHRDRFIEPSRRPRIERPVVREPDGWNPTRIWTDRDGEVERVWAQAGGGAVCLGTLETVPAGTPLFHWNSAGTVRGWSKSGVTKAEMDGRIDQNIFSLGGGLYVSLNPWDASQFGSNLVVFDSPADMRVVVYQHQMGSLEHMLGISRVTLNYALRDAGLAGVRSVAPGAGAAGLRATWINMLVGDPLASMRPGTFDDLARAAGVSQSTKRPELMALLLDVDRTKQLDLASSATLQRVSPLVVRLLRDKALSPVQHRALWPIVKAALSNERSGAIEPARLAEGRAGQALLPRLRAEFAAEIDGELQKLVVASRANEPISLAKILEDGDPNGVASYAYKAPLGLIGNLAAIGADGARLGLAARVVPDPFAGAIHAEAALHRKERDEAELQNPFGRSLLAAFALGDPAELFAAIAGQKSPPWDVPSLRGVLLDRVPALVRSGVPTNIAGLRRVHAALTDPRVDVGVVHGYLQGTPLRGERRFEEGDVEVGGKRYLRISAEERRVLEANPFLASEVVRDPASKDGLLARWEYPSAFTWRRFEGHLPKALREKLAALEPRLAGDAGVAASLTREVVTALLEKSLKLSPITELAALLHQLLAAVQPFDTANEAVIRVMVAKSDRQGAVLDRRGALLSSPEQHHVDLLAGRQKLAWLGAGLAKAEREEPGMPRFFDAPELREVERGLDAK